MNVIQSHPDLHKLFSTSQSYYPNPYTVYTYIYTHTAGCVRNSLTMEFTSLTEGIFIFLAYTVPDVLFQH